MASFDNEHFTDRDGEAIADSPEPQPCPCCGSGADQLGVERSTAEGDPEPRLQVECLNCGCNGPQAGSQLDAAQGWNERKGRLRPLSRKEDAPPARRVSRSGSGGVPGPTPAAGQKVSAPFTDCMKAALTPR
jgi:hypothetical protein